MWRDSDLCHSYLQPMDPEPPAPESRLADPRVFVVGVFLFLAIIVPVLFLIFSPSSPAIQDSKFCQTWSGSDYKYLELEKIYFRYLKEENDSLVPKVMVNDSEIMDRLLFQRSARMSTKNSIDEIKVPEKPIKILTLSALDTNDNRKCSDKIELSNYCTFVHERSEMNSADAVIFRERDERLPGRTKTSQIWIYNALTPSHRNTSDLEDVFNLTATSDFRSHIPILPFYWTETGVPLQEWENKTKEFLQNKEESKTVSLVVYNKNCNEEEEFYNKFKDIIGSLEKDSDIIVEWFNHNSNCSESNTNISRRPDCFNISMADCYKLIGPKKKFALAFEMWNTDYISERFLYPLKNFIIPIVLGGSRVKYEAVSHSDSFIYFCDYDVKTLINKLKHINSNNENSLDKYFGWQKTGRFLDMHLWYCQVCFMLLRAIDLTTVTSGEG